MDKNMEIEAQRQSSTQDINETYVIVDKDGNAAAPELTNEDMMKEGTNY